MLAGQHRQHCCHALCERNYEVRIFGSKAVLQLELWRGEMVLIDFADRRTEFRGRSRKMRFTPVRRRR